MNRNSQYYRKAALLLSNNWTQRTLIDAKGRMCLTGALRQALGAEKISLLEGMVEEIDTHLRIHSRYYRFLRARTLKMRRPLVSAITGWNDAPWRRERHVVNLLRILAVQSDQLWLLKDRSSVRAENRELKQRIQELEGQLELLTIDQQLDRLHQELTSHTA